MLAPERAIARWIHCWALIGQPSWFHADLDGVLRAPRRTAGVRLMATIMNPPGAGALQTTYRYADTSTARASGLPELTIAVLVLGTLVPWIAVALIGRRLA